jgi:ABC-type glycerol-3-phosphate transport system substrate-binding protein
MKKISRREMIKGALLAAAGGALAACQPKTVIVEKEVEKVVTQEVEKIVKETVIVEGTPKVVERTVKETVVVEVEKQPAVVELEAKLIWDTFRGPGTGWNEERIATFKQRNPKVDIEFRPLGGGQQENYAKMYAMFAADDLGDIVAFDPSHYHFVRAIEKQIIMPLTELMNADGLDLTQWFEKFITIQYYKGDIYGLPSWGWTGHDTLVANKKIFDAEGIELPDPTSHDTSMDTIGEWILKLYKENERYACTLNVSELGQVVLCRAFNTDFLNEDGTKCMLLDNPDAEEAYRWLYRLAVEEKAFPMPGELQGSFVSLTEMGRLAMEWGGSLSVRNFKRDIQDPEKAEAWQVLFPTREDGKYPSQIRGGTWNLRVGTEFPQAGYEFIKHITNTEGCIGFNLVAGQGALVRPDVLDILIARDPIHEWFLPNLNNGIPAHAPANSRGREYTDACTQWGQLLFDRENPVPFEQGFQDLADNVQKVLDEPMP